MFASYVSPGRARHGKPRFIQHRPQTRFQHSRWVRFASCAKGFTFAVAAGKPLVQVIDDQQCVQGAMIPSPLGSK